MAVDPELERHFSALHEKLQEGRWLEPDDRLQAYVGARLASRLKLKEGSRFVLTAQDASGEITGQMVRVAGTFRSGIPEMDEGFLQIPLATAQEWLGVPGAVTSEAILLRNSRDVRPVRPNCESALPTGRTKHPCSGGASRCPSSTRPSAWTTGPTTCSTWCCS